jgi:protein associated with RNAse G/E
VPGLAFLEIKHHLDGRRDEWPCEALSVTETLAVVRFVLPEPIRDVPAGAVTVGFFWRDRSYNLYVFRSPNLGYRFDVVTDVRIRPDRVQYLDLLLDVRVLPDGTVRVEDQGEVEEAASRGLLSPEQGSIIERTRDHLLERHAEIVEEALGFLQRPA